MSFSVAHYGFPAALESEHALNDGCSSCDDDECRDECLDCIDPCPLGHQPCAQYPCAEVDLCSGSVCTQTQASDSAICQEECRDAECREAEACSLDCVDTCCNDRYCAGQGETACEAVCHLPCESACPDRQCSQKWSNLEQRHCVDFHVNNANSSVWQSPYAHDLCYTDVHPSLLTFNERPPAHYFPVPRHIPSCILYGEPEMQMEEPSAKRRRTSSIPQLSASALDYSSSYFESPVSTMPMSTAPTPSLIDDTLLCHWNSDEGCEERFFDNFKLQDHLHHDHIGHQTDNICLWDDCGVESRDSQSLFNHIKDCHVPLASAETHQRQLVCLWANCNAVFSREEDFHQHMDFHVKAACQCRWDSCQFWTQTEADLEAHVQSHHLPQATLEPHPLPTPVATPNSPEERDGAKRCCWVDIDESGRPQVCGLEFSSTGELQNHAKTVHIAGLKKKTGYYCRWADCNRKDKPFSQKGKVERHLQTHTGYKSCTCAQCGKEFSAPQALQQHIRTHTGEKPYKCDVCGKEFAQGSAMTMHKRVHTGERPLKCDFPGCNKCFSESSNLSKHRKTHNPVGQHRCGFPGCQRSFHRLDQMKRHQRTHGDFDSTSPSPSP